MVDTQAPESDTAADSTSELRTFLIADVRGYTRFTQERGDAAAAQLVAKFSAASRAGIEGRGGRLLELRGDEVLAVFGSARQALRAAVDLQARFAQETEADPSLPLRVGIGLDAGEAVPFEGGYRGEALNLAARLCNLAGPGEVLASEGVVYLGRQVPGVLYDERGLVPIKGFANPVRVIRVVRTVEALEDAFAEVGARAALHPPGAPEPAIPIGGFLGALPSGALIGREREWERIIASLDEVANGRGQLVLLSGEPGIGKTRLAQEVTLKARHWGFVVATGRCYEPEQAVPYYPFIEALSTLYELSSAAVKAEIPRRWPQLGRLLPDQVGFLPSGLSDGYEDQTRLFRAVTGWLEAIAEEGPVALLLDDLHWADDTSIQLLQHLARNTRAYRVLLLGTYRDVDVHRHHPLEAALLDMSRQSIVTDVEVRRLDQAGTAALMAEIMGEQEDLADLAELVYRRTDGNAFFIGEVLHALVERGDVYRKDGHWERRAVAEMEVPKSIRSVIGQRLSRLEERAQEILREASVLGQTFAFDDLLAMARLVPARLHEATPADDTALEDELDAAIEQALAATLVRETGAETYAFNHALTQQALYAELSTRRRKRLHIAAGRGLERLDDRERTRRAAELAYHFLEGDDAEHALPYAMLAGDRAESVFANGEAERHFRTALELAEELDDRILEIDALERLAGVLTIGARYDRALERLERAAALQRAVDNREGEACTVARIGHVHYLRGTRHDGIARLKPLVDAIDTDHTVPMPSYGMASLLAALARLYIDSDRYPEQRRVAERAVQMARSLPYSAEARQLLTGAEVTLTDALWGLGQEDEALAVLEELIPRADAMGDLENLSRALGNAAVYFAQRGDIERNLQYHERLLRMSERRGDRANIVLAAMNLSTTAFQLGNWDEARSYLERAERIIRSLGTTRLTGWPIVARGWLSLRQGDLEVAEAYGREALALAEGAGDAVTVRYVRRMLAEKELLDSKPGEAMQLLAPSLDATNLKDDSGFLRTLAWASLQLGHQAEARSTAAWSTARARADRARPDIVESLVVEGMVLAGGADWAEAEAAFSEAAELAASMPYPYGEARARYESGIMRIARGTAEEALAPLQSALAVFERLGAAGDVRWTREALAAIHPSPEQ